MHRTHLLASALAALLAGSASVAVAQSSTTPTTPATSSAATSAQATPMRTHGRGAHERMSRMHGVDQQQDGVLGDLHAMERLYLQAGRSKELTSLYNDVLARSQNPRVRDYAYQGLARLQAQPANVDQAIATLRKALDESLAEDAKARDAREKMRSNWQQRKAAQPAPVTPAS